jgi:hypothetical protein
MTELAFRLLVGWFVVSLVVSPAIGWWLSRGVE